MLALALAFATSSAHAGSWAPGTEINPAGAVDITPEGLDAVTAILPAFVPSRIDIDDVSDWPGSCFFNVGYGISGLWVGVQIQDASITPQNGVLLFEADLLVNVNDNSDPFSLEYDLSCISGSCEAWVTPFPVHISTTIGLGVVTNGDGTRSLDASVGTITVDYGLSGDNLDSSDCSTILDIADTLGLIDTLIDQVTGPLQDTIDSLAPTIETTIEDAFASANISQDLDLNGVTAHITLSPSDVTISPSGVRVNLAGSVVADAADCVSAWDPGGSLATPSGLPTLGEAPSGVDSPFHAGLSLSDDFANQAVYALWRGGLLCYTVEPGGKIPLDTSILNLLTGQAFAELFPESQPLVLVTSPKKAPTVSYDGTHDVDINVEQLGIDMYAELDGRQARVISVELEGPIGADLAFDGATGNLGVNLDIAADNLTPSLGWNEFYPDQSETILAAFSSSFGSLVEQLIGGLIPDIAFALPSMSGVGLQELDVAPTGSNLDWLGAYAWIGAVTYGDGSSGCGSCGGDTGSDCSGGCSSQGPLPPYAPALLVLGVAVGLRRRR